MKQSTLLLSAFAALPLAVFAQTTEFDFQDPKGVNNVIFILDAPLEQISGSANGISGSVKGHPDNPAEVTGKIVVDAKTIQVPNPLMKEHLHSPEWLDTTAHPEITFELKNVSNIKQEGSSGSADVTGIFTMRGISKELTVPVRATYLPGRLKDRGGDVDGDLLVLRSDFKIKRSDFGIKPGQNEDKVSDEIEIKLNVAGAAPKS